MSSTAAAKGFQGVSDAPFLDLQLPDAAPVQESLQAIEIDRQHVGHFEKAEYRRFNRPIPGQIGHAWAHRRQVVFWGG